jgi:adenine-specific DNA glycosylase
MRFACRNGPDPPRSVDGWELVLAENVAYLVDDERRWEALERLRRTVGLEPDRILAATDEDLRAVVIGMRPDERISRLRRCAELALSNAPWRAYPGIGAPGAERIDLLTAARPVLALDSNGLRVLVRLGYADTARSYPTTYRQAQATADLEIPETVAARRRAHQLLRRHGLTVCRRRAPSCATCPIRDHCPSAGHPPALY